MVDTTIGMVISEEQISKYFKSLVNKVFKILPIIENQEESIATYLDSLGCELNGFKSLLPSVGEDPLFLSLLAIYKWLFDSLSESDSEYKVIRREVFHAISICKKLEGRYANGEGEVV